MKKMLAMFAIAAAAVACTTTTEEEVVVEDVAIDSTYVDSATLEANFDDDSFGEEAAAE